MKPKTESPDAGTVDALEVLLDPIRSKIVFEIIFKGEVTADKLVDITKKSRSTISHHLKKLVESGLIDVYMNPTGKIKYYRINQNITDMMYTLDKESLLASPIEERSAFVLDMQQFFVIINHIYTSVLTDQIKKLEQNQPFEDVFYDEKTGDLWYKIKGKSYPIPYHSSIITNEEEALFLIGKMREVMKEYQEKFGGPEGIMERLKEEPKYLFKAQIFPYLDIEE
ncbi:MAG: winged helix-turn-helix transcriptional regulator [Candidatus Heimdallarchaeota archaeon]|nr:winged helix-turn-helix transcriptional regulator [Candidatus Heimdallarchaeota archaeon]MCK4289572.1 winged helix-turn-helix transcriptional regulator [Candidatus Heimdallarchaeota archaeon]